jgi:penicillin-binding protein 1A
MAKASKEKSGISTHIIRSAWAIWAVGILVVALTFTLLSFNLPSFEELENPDINLATVVYSNDGTPFGKYYIENREPINFEDLNPLLTKALISTEDSRFHGHSGIDFIALGRVISKSLLLGRREQGGGSTITQQLAKLLFDRPSLSGNKVKRSFQMIGIKFKEWLTAIRLEKSYTKEEIIAMYLNQFDFIYGAHGIQAASQTYFGKTQDQLLPEEAATLIGMLKNPALYNPRRFPENASSRRNVVMSRMKASGHLTTTTYDSLKMLTMDMSSFKRDMHSEGPAPYFRMELTKWLKDLFTDKNYRKPDGSKYNIYKDGLKVYTSIDLHMQEHAERIMFEHLAEVQERFRRTWGRMDPWTYKTDRNQRQIRKESLNNRIRESERYQNAWLSMMGRQAESMKEKYGLNSFNDRDVNRLLNEEKKPGTSRKLVARKELSESRAKAYEEILKSEDWADIKEIWEAFEKKIKTDFNKEISMKVFAYNDDHFEIKSMTPLDSIKYHRMILQCGSIGVEPQTGKVKYWIGGSDHRFFKFDHV